VPSLHGLGRVRVLRCFSEVNASSYRIIPISVRRRNPHQQLLILGQRMLRRVAVTVIHALQDLTKKIGYKTFQQSEVTLAKTQRLCSFEMSWVFPFSLFLKPTYILGRSLSSDDESLNRNCSGYPALKIHVCGG
jgi:hypothetical protein